MHSSSHLLDIVSSHTTHLDLAGIRKVLLLYDEKIFFIGDCCKRFDKLSYVRAFLNDASITINFSHEENRKFFEGLLRNNPSIDEVSTCSWDEIDFLQYDLLYCISYNEDRLLDFLGRKYGTAIDAGQYKPAIYSMSSVILKPILHSKYIFPEHKELMAEVSADKPGKLFISTSERQWADDWLYKNGLGLKEDLYILLDSTTAREKLLDISVYFDFLSFLLDSYPGKILIFDEDNMGKEMFYGEWLGQAAMKRIIVSKGHSLRDNLCLIGSSHTKMVFGPCTGLMHCASGIYNNYVGNGMPSEKIPLLITYTGEYSAENVSADFWWSNAPLINCLLLKKSHGGKKLVELNSLDKDQRQRNDSLACAEYSAPMLTGYVAGKLSNLNV